MNTAKTYKTVSTSPAASLKLGEQIGHALKGGEVIELASDLGGGKTVIVKGIASGLQVKGEVASPTFTISRVYPARDDLELQHFDFYRIGSTDIVAMELREVVGDDKTIVAIEWAGNAGDALPKARIRIDIKATGETERDISVTALDPKFDYVVEALK